MKKVLFLDIDGVLNCMYPTPPYDSDINYADECRYGFNPVLVDRLKYIIAITGCKIVVSSTWRLHDSYAPFQPSRNWRDVLAEKLGKTREELFAGETGYDNTGKRGIEIKRWLDENPVDSFCVVDDEIVDIVPYIDKNQVVKTDMRNGLSSDDVSRIIDVLKINS